MAAIAPPPPIAVSPSPAPPSNRVAPETGWTPRDYRWTREEYLKLADSGIRFRNRVELIGGRIIEMPPQKDPHAFGIVKATNAAFRTFGIDQYCISVQLPLDVGGKSMPEPDLAVTPGPAENYAGTGHPTSALLVIEVSEATLKFDRRKKGPRYARAGYADYWIVNLVDRCLEVFRNPVADPSAPHGWRYENVLVLTPPATISPLAAPAAVIAVTDLLP